MIITLMGCMPSEDTIMALAADGISWPEAFVLVGLTSACCWTIAKIFG